MSISYIAAANIGPPTEKILCKGDIAPWIDPKFFLPNKSARRDCGKEDSPPHTTAYGIQQNIKYEKLFACDIKNKDIVITNKELAIM